MGNLVIVESPAKAGTIQKYLGNGYTVKSSFGHIRDLDEKSLSIDIEDGFKPEYKVPADKKKVVSELKKEAEKADMVWLASDEDREGEAISWHLYETLGLSPEKTHRIVFHEITKNAILNAIKNPRDIDMDLVYAQQARRVLDRLVGFELSPVLWKKIQPKLSAGRVQSVALRLVVDREREIMAFQKEQYYKVEGTFHPARLDRKISVKALLDKKFPDAVAAQEFLESCKDASFAIESIDKKEGLKFPSAPFTTSTLQQEAARRYRMSVSQVMSIAQRLYERGLITYMRTDSTNLSSLALNTAKDFIINNFGEEYSKPRQYKTKTKGAQEAHEAIRPTFIENTSIEGTPQEKRLYDLIWKRTVASQMADAKVLKTDIKIASDKTQGHFCVQSNQILFDGFLTLSLSGDEDSAEGETMLPEMFVGDVMERIEINAECKFTAPPQRYSEGTLVKKLEELEIGRPSTYAPTITTLTKGRGYIQKGDKEGEKTEVVNYTLKKDVISSRTKVETTGAEKGKLLPQDIGIIVTDYLTKHFTDIMDYSFTAGVEEKFDTIAKGEMEWTDAISDFYDPFHKSVEIAMKDRNYDRIERHLGCDPADGLEIIAKYGQYGPFVQKGEGDKRICVSLAPGQIIESITLEEAVKLFALPRSLGEYKGTEIICTKGRYGAYLKYGERNITLPKGENPTTISYESCCKLIDAALEKPAPGIIKEYESADIKVMSGLYGPYIKHAGSNYKIPKGTNVEDLTEEACLKIISEGAPTQKGRGRRFSGKKTK